MTQDDNATNGRKPWQGIGKMIAVGVGMVMIVVVSFLGGVWFSEQDDTVITATPQPTRDAEIGRDNPVANTRVPPRPSPTMNTATPIPPFIVNDMLRNGVSKEDSMIMQACPYVECEQVRQMSSRIPFLVTGVVEDGDMIDGVTIWYRVEYRDDTMYVHSLSVNLLDDALGNAEATEMPEVLALTPQWDCSRDIYNCSSFDNRVTLMSYFNACPSDPSRLDRDGDGVPCESIP